MTITPIAFVNAGSDIAVDADLARRYPLLPQEVWSGQVNYRTQLQEAFSRAIRDVTANNSYSDPALISNSATNIAWFKQAVIEAALAGIFLSFMAESGDRWHALSQYHEKQYQMWLGNIRIDYDVDEDGSVSDSEEKHSSQTELVR